MHSASFQGCHGNAIGFEVANKDKERKLAIFTDRGLGFQTALSGAELETFGSRVQCSNHSANAAS